jgi:hypothetical protein
MFKGKVLLFSLLVAFATSVYAGDVDECESEWGLSDTLCTFEISICPMGDFEWIYEACGGTSEYFWVIAKDISGNGIPGIPWTDYWINACDPAQELCICANPMVADSLTSSSPGVEGRTTISSRIAAGGCVLTDGIYRAVQGKVLLEMPLTGPPCTEKICHELIIVGPDLNANCKVELGDLAVYGLAHNCPGPLCNDPKAYDRCCDFNDDAYVNLSDFAYMGEHYQHECF